MYMLIAFPVFHACKMSRWKIQESLSSVALCKELVDGYTSLPIYQCSVKCCTHLKDGRAFTAVPQITRTLNNCFSAHFFLKSLHPKERVTSAKLKCDLIRSCLSLSTSQNSDIPIRIVKEQLLCAH